MKAAEIKDGKVVNLITVSDLTHIPGLVNGEGANIGDTWDGSVFIRKVPTLEEAKNIKLRETNKMAVRKLRELFPEANSIAEAKIGIAIWESLKTPTSKPSPALQALINISKRHSDGVADISAKTNNAEINDHDALEGWN